MHIMCVISSNSVQTRTRLCLLSIFKMKPENLSHTSGQAAQYRLSLGTGGWLCRFAVTRRKSACSFLHKLPKENKLMF